MSLAISTLDRPLRVTAEPAMSREEFWRFSAENPNLRMERQANGEVIIMTPTKRNTGSRNFYICCELGKWAEADGDGEGFDSSTGFDLPDGSTLSPDASWVTHERVIAAERDGEELELCPDFVIELRSDSDSLRELREKMERWIANGAQLAWLIDPKRKTVEIYRPSQHPEVQEGHAAAHGEGPVAGFVLELARVWA